MGRPAMEFNQEVADYICTQIADGRSLRAILREDKEERLPAAVTLYKWMEAVPEFAKQYARAKEDSADAMSDDIMAIADEETKDAVEVNRNRLRVEARKWLAAKMKPKKYGEKIEQTHQGPDGQSLNLEVIFKKVEEK